MSSTCFGQLFCPSSGALACVLSLCYFLYQWCTVKQITDNEIYLIFKYIKSVLWSVAKCLSYIEDTRCLKVKTSWVQSKEKRFKYAWTLFVDAVSNVWGQKDRLCEIYHWRKDIPDVAVNPFPFTHTLPWRNQTYRHSVLSTLMLIVFSRRAQHVHCFVVWGLFIVPPMFLSPRSLFHTF